MFGSGSGGSRRYPITFEGANFMRISAQVFLVIVLSSSVCSAQDSSFFWSEVMPSWRQIREDFSTCESIMTTQRIGGLGQDPKGNEVSTKKLFLNLGQRKMEWFKDGELDRAFAENSEMCFSINSSPGGGMAIHRLSEPSSSPWKASGDAMTKQFAQLYAATSIQPGRALYDITPEGPYVVDKCTRDGGYLNVTLRHFKADETIRLKLDQSRGWAITYWEHEFESLIFSRGRNVFYDSTPFGRAFPKTVTYELKVKGKVKEALLSNFEQPVQCQLPKKAFFLAHYGVSTPAIPESVSKVPPPETVSKGWFGFGLLGFLAAGYAIWRQSRQHE